MLTNNGSGVFGFKTTLTAGSGSFCVAAADLNGNGRVDLVSANFTPGTLTVFTNNGSGVFGSNATLTVDSAPVFVAAADINRDGKLDLISASSGKGTLTVLTNNGSGTFGFYATFAVGHAPFCFVPADVNDDGKLDLISANFGDNTVTVLTQTGVGSPTLTIKRTNTNTCAVSWSSFWPGFALQTNSDLTTTNWKTSGYTISTSGTNQSTTVTSSPLATLFFRLAQ